MSTVIDTVTNSENTVIETCSAKSLNDSFAVELEDKGISLDGDSNWTFNKSIS
jgi:hypothetical protein